MGARAGLDERSAPPRDDSASARVTRAISALTAAMGSFPAILASLAVVLVWLLTGPVFGFSDTWQLIINTGTTIITFNMVFVIQNTQNRDGRAIQTKLDAIMAALDGVDDRLIGLEEQPERAIKREQEAVRNGSTFADLTVPATPHR